MNTKQAIFESVQQVFAGVNVNASSPDDSYANPLAVFGATVYAFDNADDDGPDFVGACQKFRLTALESDLMREAAIPVQLANCLNI